MDSRNICWLRIASSKTLIPLNLIENKSLPIRTRHFRTAQKAFFVTRCERGKQISCEERPWRCASSNQSSVAPQQLHPILSSARSSSSAALWEWKRSRSICSDCSILLRSSILGSSQLRSEERRVGKECVS